MKIFGGKLGKLVKSFAHDFTASYVADIVSKGSGGGQEVSGSVAGTIGHKLGSNLRGSFMGLSPHDEAAILQALAMLEPHEAAIMAERIKALGDPTKDDTPEARAFRRVLVELENAEERLTVLRSCASLDDESFQTMVKVTGAASASQMVAWINNFKKIPQWVKDADANAAANMVRLGNRFRQAIENIKNA